MIPGFGRSEVVINFTQINAARCTLFVEKRPSSVAFFVRFSSWLKRGVPTERHQFHHMTETQLVTCRSRSHRKKNMPYKSIKHPQQPTIRAPFIPQKTRVYPVGVVLFWITSLSLMMWCAPNPWSRTTAQLLGPLKGSPPQTSLGCWWLCMNCFWGLATGETWWNLGYRAIRSGSQIPKTTSLWTTSHCQSEQLYEQLKVSLLRLYKVVLPSYKLVHNPH